MIDDRVFLVRGGCLKKDVPRVEIAYVGICLYERDIVVNERVRDRVGIGQKA